MGFVSDHASNQPISNSHNQFKSKFYTNTPNRSKVMAKPNDSPLTPSLIRNDLGSQNTKNSNLNPNKVLTQQGVNLGRSHLEDNRHRLAGSEWEWTNQILKRKLSTESMYIAPNFMPRSGREASCNSVRSRSRSKSILKKKLGAQTVKYFTPFEPKHKSAQIRAAGLCGRFTQRHLQKVNRKLLHTIETRSRRSEKSDAGSTGSGVRNTIFVGRNKVLVRDVIENFGEGSLGIKAQLEAKSIKNKILKKNLKGTEDEGLKLRLKDEEMRLGALKKLHRASFAGTFYFAHFMF